LSGTHRKVKLFFNCAVIFFCFFPVFLFFSFSTLGKMETAPQGTTADERPEEQTVQVRGS
jgi:hypothetical protein